MRYKLTNSVNFTLCITDSLNHAKAQILSSYPPSLTEQVNGLINSNKLEAFLLTKYPHSHELKTEKALYDFVQEIKSKYLKKNHHLSPKCSMTKRYTSSTMRLVFTLLSHVCRVINSKQNMKFASLQFSSRLLSPFYG